MSDFTDYKVADMSAETISWGRKELDYCRDRNAGPDGDT